VWNVKQGPGRLTLNSPALRVSVGKTGVGRGEWEVNSTQNVVVLSRESQT
jgi:hypothetical protein